ncbi:hypothetical protein SDC9_172534 [bioreactor metagenome]|uniref:Uncharacterized protein n=1 Tax=bioreactor metagenome TaxID=1076179 RepID=A0A645GDZ2_9ZZZZ
MQVEHRHQGVAQLDCAPQQGRQSGRDDQFAVGHHFAHLVPGHGADVVAQLEAEAGQPGGQDERQPDLLVVEERVDRPQRLGRRETGSTVEPIDGFIDAHWTTAVSRLDTHG